MKVHRILIHLAVCLILTAGTVVWGTDALPLTPSLPMNGYGGAAVPLALVPGRTDGLQNVFWEYEAQKVQGNIAKMGVFIRSAYPATLSRVNYVIAYPPDLLEYDHIERHWVAISVGDPGIITNVTLLQPGRLKFSFDLGNHPMAISINDHAVAQMFFRIRKAGTATYRLYHPPSEKWVVWKPGNEMLSGAPPLSSPNWATLSDGTSGPIRFDEIKNVVIPPVAINFSLTASAGTGGTISPSGIVSVIRGASQTFAITPKAGYSLVDVKVDSVSVGKVLKYTISNVTANHSIAATFKVSAPNGGPAGYTWCAVEKGTYVLSGTCDVAYGANGYFFYKYGVKGSMTFSNITFGDPIPGVLKNGYYKAQILTAGQLALAPGD